MSIWPRCNVVKLFRKEKHIEGRKYNLCKAIREWMQDERAKGKEEGRAEGREEGKEEGRMEGEAKGIIRTLRRYQVSEKEIVAQLVSEMNVTEEKAKEYMKMVELV